MAKKLYWLKLKKDFFKRHDVRIIEAMPNGKDYVLFYLKMLVESLDHEGKLRFSETIPYNAEMLATITNTNIDIVRAALKIFEELQMVEILDDHTIYMQEVNKMTGCETDEHTREQNRIRQQRYRDKQKLEIEDKTLHNVSVTLNRNVEKELEIEKDKEKDKKEKLDYDFIVNKFNEKCISLPKVTILSEKRKKAMDRVFIKETVIDINYLDTLFDKVESSDFLTGRKTNWKANFDWLMNPTNIAKVIDGNYSNNTEAPNIEQKQDVNVDSEWQ